ncbi:MAG: SDR family NAD(P)-dependent oxidoreductase, partial [Flavobacteriales bacterium]
MSAILIIGASRGIGHALAERLMRDGRSVITMGRTQPGLAGAAAHITHDVLGPDLPTAELPEALGGLVYCPGSMDLKPFRSTRADDLR